MKKMKKIFWRVSGVVWLCAGLISCAASKNTFVLVPDPDGTVGRIEVSTPAGSRTLTRAGETTAVADPGAPPAAPKILAARDIDRLFGAVLAAEPTPPARFLLYFETGSAILVPESEALIPEILAAVRARGSVDIGVVGHTDSVGNPEVNDRLALSRAQRVKDILLAAAVPSEAIEISSHGKNNPLVPTPDETPEPRNRRVEVIVR